MGGGPFGHAPQMIGFASRQLTIRGNLSDLRRGDQRLAGG